MKTLPVLPFCMLVFFSCKKDADNTVKTVPNVVPFPQTTILSCQFAPNYGDSIVFPQPAAGADLIVSPSNNQGIPGRYFAWPEGLSINATTGAIDLTQSVSGLRYNIGFVKTGTTDTCLSPLIVGGVSYADSVYALSMSDTTAPPYFNGNIYGPDPCNASGPNNGNKCAFDIYGNAKDEGIVIDKKTGYVNLKKTIQQIHGGVGALYDGETYYSTFYYQIDDNSNNAVQKMEIEFMYYTDKSKIPADVLSLVRSKLSNIFNGILIGTTGSPKPPLIIIIRN